MTLLAARHTAQHAPRGVLTVADLLSRYGPATVEADLETAPLPVQNLLRREGDRPRAARPAPTPTPAPVEDCEVTQYRPDVRPRSHQDDERYDYEGAAPRRRPSRRTVQRGAIAASVLLAAGTVFGVSLLDLGSAPAGDDRALPASPVPPRLDGTTSAAAPTAAAGGLDPGAAVDTEWMDTAFPPTPSDTPASTSSRPRAGSVDAPTPPPSTRPPRSSRPPVGNAPPPASTTPVETVDPPPRP